MITQEIQLFSFVILPLTSFRDGEEHQEKATHLEGVEQALRNQLSFIAIPLTKPITGLIQQEIMT